MAHDHLQPGEVGDVGPLGAQLETSKTSTLLKTATVEAIRLVLPPGKRIPEHKAPGEIIVQCLEGRVEFTTMGKTLDLTAGKLLFLPAGEPHALHALEGASILVTLLLPAGKQRSDNH